MILAQPASAKQIPSMSIKSPNKMIIATTFFVGFISSILLALLMNLFKEYENKPTTTTTSRRIS
jgi:uncharacterized protein involved in exopolysaccharide biosynthesis